MIQNKYSKIYNSIIERARSRINPVEFYIEKHHIMPKSLGGSNEFSNIVALTAREHYIVHHLLVKMTIGNDHRKMIHAWWAISAQTKNSNRHKPTSKQYEIAKILKSKVERDKRLGVPHSEKSKLKMSLAKKGVKRKPFSEESKLKMSSSRTGVKRKPFSEEHKANMRLAKLQYWEEKRKLKIKGM